MTTTSAPSKRSKRKTYHHGDLVTELLRAAELELSKNGLESFSLRAVTKRAGVSHGAPAHHFADANGLLTALAANGYERMVEAQETRQLRAAADPLAQLIAAGLGYIDFAMENPSLFRLMFSSERPDRDNERFARTSMLAFNKLVADISLAFDVDPFKDPVAMRQVMTSWSMVHGLAELVISGRAEIPLGFGQMTPSKRDDVLTDIMLRAVR